MSVHRSQRLRVGQLVEWRGTIPVLVGRIAYITRLCGAIVCGIDFPLHSGLFGRPVPGEARRYTELLSQYIRPVRRKRATSKLVR